VRRSQRTSRFITAGRSRQGWPSPAEAEVRGAAHRDATPLTAVLYSRGPAWSASRFDSPAEWGAEASLDASVALSNVGLPRGRVDTADAVLHPAGQPPTTRGGSGGVREQALVQLRVSRDASSTRAGMSQNHALKVASARRMGEGRSSGGHSGRRE
jgi:hypothetical protein